MGDLGSGGSTAPWRRIRALAFIVFLAVGVVAVHPVAPIAAQEASPTTGGAAAQATPLPEGFTQRMADQVDDVIARVPKLRELEALDQVTYRNIPSDQFRAEIEALFDKEFPPGYVAAEDDLLTRLDLIGPDVDLRAAVLSLFESQALAYYDPSSKTFSLIGPITKLGPAESVFVAHEYVHALQDQHWDLEGTRITDPSQGDEILAQQALAEGDASSLMTDWMLDWVARHKNGSAMQKALERVQSRQDERLLRKVPPILQRQLFFPYLEGLAFVIALRGRGDWAAVDAAWEQRPVSTEQIMHPEKYPDELPVEITLPDVVAALGDGWTKSYVQTLGEMQIGVWLSDDRKGTRLGPTLPLMPARSAAAAGWGGDRLVSLDGPNGAWAVVWQTDWDTQRDADEFLKAARQASKNLEGAHVVTTDDVVGGLSSPVLVLVADSKATLSTMEAVLDESPEAHVAGE